MHDEVTRTRKCSSGIVYRQRSVEGSGQSMKFSKEFSKLVRDLRVIFFIALAGLVFSGCESGKPLSPNPTRSDVDRSSADGGEELPQLGEATSVLYLEGTPTWEYRYLRSYFASEPRLNETVFLASEQSDLGAALNAIDIEDFDVVVLGDMSSTPAYDSVLNGLEAFTRSGGRVLCVSPDLAATGEAEWQRLLPVQAEQGARARVVGAIEVTPEGLTALGDNVAAALAKTEFHATQRDLRVMPEARVWLVSKEQQVPLIVEGKCGEGEFVWIGSNELWRVRLHDRSTVHYQTHLFLLQKVP